MQDGRRLTAHRRSPAGECSRWGRKGAVARCCPVLQNCLFFWRDDVKWSPPGLPVKSTSPLIPSPPPPPPPTGISIEDRTGWISVCNLHRADTHCAKPRSKQLHCTNAIRWPDGTVKPESDLVRYQNMPLWFPATKQTSLCITLHIVRGYWPSGTWTCSEAINRLDPSF